MAKELQPQEQVELNKLIQPQIRQFSEKIFNYGRAYHSAERGDLKNALKLIPPDSHLHLIIDWEKLCTHMGKKSVCAEMMKEIMQIVNPS